MTPGIKKIVIVIIIVAALFLIGWELAAAQSSATNIIGYGWSETIGWIKLNGANYSMRFNPTTNAFSGYGWSENIGWINFNGISLNSSNKLIGEARFCAGALNGGTCSGGTSPLSGNWDGRLSMSSSNYGVNMVREANEPCPFEGWAWGSDVVGWVRFSPNYCNYMPPPPPPTEKINCDFSADPTWLLYPRSYATLQWSCDTATACQISGVGNVNPKNGSTGINVYRTTSYTLNCSNADGETASKTVEIKVYNPIYCEIIPNGPGCSN